MAAYQPANVLLLIAAWFRAGASWSSAHDTLREELRTEPQLHRTIR